jgi:hypothetical protein
MKDQTRRALAYVVLRLTAAKPFSGVRDQAAAKSFHFDAEIPPTKTKILARERGQGCCLKGAGGGGFYTLTNESTGKPLSLKLKENQFEGFDYDSGKPYHGTVTGNSVSIHDAEVAKEFQYGASF